MVEYEKTRNPFSEIKIVYLIKLYFEQKMSKIIVMLLRTCM